MHAGLTALGRAQSRLGSIDLRTAMAIHGRELAELGVADAIARGDDEQVHEAVERSHASSTRLAPVRVDATAEEAAFLARLRRASEALWRLDTAAAPDRAEDLRREIAALQLDLRQQGWQRTATGSDVDLVGLEEVRRHLDRTGAVVVSFTSVGPRLCAVRIDRDAVRVVELGSMAEILRLVEQLRSDLQAVVLPGIPESVRAVMKGSVRTTLGRLDDHLLGPLDLDEPPLVVVPHGALALVPWSLVPSRLGLATTTIPSLTTWARSNAQARHRPGTEPVSVVAMAGPGLERADAEVLAVAGAWPDARSVRGGAATGPALQAALHRATVVHLAAHGHHQASSPLFSSLRLADGPIFAHELDPDPTARLVVLSSCEVGSHTVRHGDEPLGLTAALLQAGVPTVLAGLARVRDDTAHDLMIDLHHQVVEGATPAQALATAVHRAWQRGRVAPFACLGAGLLPVG